MHLEFTDINWVEGTLRVQGKPRWAFTVKAWEQRDVPVPDDVLEALKEWRNVRVRQTLILGTKNRLPNTKLLRTLKRLAHRAGLNYELCESCRERKECGEYTLHWPAVLAVHALRPGHADLSCAGRVHLVQHGRAVVSGRESIWRCEHRPLVHLEFGAAGTRTTAAAEPSLSVSRCASRSCGAPCLRIPPTQFQAAAGSKARELSMSWAALSPPWLQARAGPIRCLCP